MKICEIFKSIQGEGRLVGVVSVFVRVSACNLRCAWCDSKTSRSGFSFQLSVDELVLKLLKYNCKCVVITGGEPMMCPEIIMLTERLKMERFHITIETNATIICRVECDLVSMSPKLSHSNPEGLSPDEVVEYNNKRIQIEVVNYYITSYNYQIKFVVRTLDDFHEIDTLLEQLDRYDPFNVLIMPLASTKRQLFNIQKDIISACVKKGYRYANRLQLQVWGNRKGV